MAYPGYDTFCRYCGKPIIFIRTGAGKLMPCDATPVKYWRAEDGGGILIYQRDGSSTKGRLRGHDAACAGSGYVPHWTSCTNRPKPKREERPPTPGELKIREQIARERAKREAADSPRARQAGGKGGQEGRTRGGGDRAPRSRGDAGAALLMAGLDEQRCRSCHYYSNEIGCCDYIGITGHTRGEIVCLPNGRRYIRYPEICQHYRRKAGTVAAPGTMNFEAAAAKTVKEKPRRRALKEFPERLELYRQGLTDAEIGEKLGVSVKTIANWRLSRELPAHSSQARQFEHNETKRLELYDQGLTDSELAAACGCHIETIRAWRRRHRLENNGPGRGNRSRDKRRAPMYMPVREALYAAGLSDAEIAERLQVAKSTITNWRHRRGYPPNTARKGESNEGENQQDGLLQARGEPAS